KDRTTPAHVRREKYAASFGVHRTRALILRVRTMFWHRSRSLGQMRPGNGEPEFLWLPRSKHFVQATIGQRPGPPLLDSPNEFRSEHERAENRCARHSL